MPTHYEVLEISPGSTDSEIKQAYRLSLIKLHPDKQHLPHADTRTVNEDRISQLQLVQKAWQVARKPAASLGIIIHRVRLT
jgi:curved DNA-binding protein CbpA